MNPIANPETIPMTTTRIVKKLRSRVIVENVYEANKGTGAGGSNTNLFGTKFEFKTDNEKRLLSHGRKVKYKPDLQTPISKKARLLSDEDI